MESKKIKKIKKIAKIVSILTRIWHDLIELWEVLKEPEEKKPVE